MADWQAASLCCTADPGHAIQTKVQPEATCLFRGRSLAAEYEKSVLKEPLVLLHLRLQA